MKSQQIAGALGVAASTALGVAGVTGWYIARRLTAPVGRRMFDLTIRGVEQADRQTWVVLRRRRDTEAPGLYNLWFERGGWAQLGDDVQDRGPDRVARVVTATSPGLAPQFGDRVSWSGIYFATPADAGLVHRDIVIKTLAGDAPAWRIDGDTNTWAIHIHGLGSPRAGSLRGVQVATELGYTSLVVSYRNDGEGPRVGNGRSTLGATETDDVDEAIGYAIRRGAQEIVLFGWSMGAAIALRLARRAAYRGLIVALVLESPVLDWTEVIMANCARAGIPRAAGRLAVPWLTSQPLARMVGLPRALPLGQMGRRHWEKALTVPTLILQGARDDSTPIAEPRKVRDAHPELVALEVFDAGHTLTWNVDPLRWRHAVTDWLSKVAPT